MLSEKISEYLRLTHIENESENGYIVSSYLLYVNAREMMVEFAERLSRIEKQYHQLLVSYTNILKVKRSIPMTKRPEPSAIFLNVPQYNRIYTCILRWFSKKGYDLINERVMLNFINAPAIYEAYVLIKLINQIKARGYELVESKTVVYPRQANWFYRNQNYNNTFVFTSEDAKITLYYEPVIYDDDKASINGIGIYRNNSVSLNRETDDENCYPIVVCSPIVKKRKGIIMCRITCLSMKPKKKNSICSAMLNLAEKIR